MWSIFISILAQSPTLLLDRDYRLTRDGYQGTSLGAELVGIFDRSAPSSLQVSIMRSNRGTLNALWLFTSFCLTPDFSVEASRARQKMIEWCD